MATTPGMTLSSAALRNAPSSGPDGCCAPATSGQAAPPIAAPPTTALPIRVMNSRRFIWIILPFGSREARAPPGRWRNDIISRQGLVSGHGGLLPIHPVAIAPASAAPFGARLASLVSSDPTATGVCRHDHPSAPQRALYAGRQCASAGKGE